MTTFEIVLCGLATTPGAAFVTTEFFADGRLEEFRWPYPETDRRANNKKTPRIDLFFI